ncbi:transposase [Halosquirtibacter laminarini]|uniref:Transposase n=1 Tax=Halosquirtibacter laminarini TaxID=3374600 RepID=A0AC61NMF9_9BACT|nr:transposase [Prolixibacteraceae bacterium]
MEPQKDRLGYIDRVKNYSESFTENYGLPQEWKVGNIPHRNKKHLVQSLTLRLSDSLPQYVVEKMLLIFKNNSSEYHEIDKRKKYESYLNVCYGCCAMKHFEMASIVFDVLKYHHGKRYDLLAWSIMPNHVHVLIRNNENIDRIIWSWKSFISKWAFKNQHRYHLGLPSGVKHLWMPEYWDRFIRNEEHFDNTVRYILNNPYDAHLDLKSPAYLFTGCNL